MKILLFSINFSLRGYSILLAISLFAIGCHDVKFSFENSDSFQLPQDLKGFENIQDIIVIPRAGFTGCIDEVVNYVLNRLDSMQNTKVVFTSIEGLKELKIKLGERINHSVVYLDTDNIFFRPGALQSIYPQHLQRIKGNKFLKKNYTIKKKGFINGCIVF